MVSFEHSFIYFYFAVCCQHICLFFFQTKIIIINIESRDTKHSQKGNNNKKKNLIVLKGTILYQIQMRILAEKPIHQPNLIKIL